VLLPFLAWPFFDSQEGSNMSTSTLSASPALALPLSQRLILAIGSCLLGAALIFCAGFAPMEVLHNAAHDARHSAAFPCH
jgi:cobalt transporter subunit CbtB